ncbi:MAG: UPF0280 family protein [Candidatus Thorarchaeota archaeon]|nr:UPF0280 family protein [Candidatus Thorarchaeota archaeon]
MRRTHISIGETYATLLSEPEFVRPAEQAVAEARRSIVGYLRSHAEFGDSLEPVRVSDTAPAIVQHMANAASTMRVGPMAAVAGAIAQYVVERLVDLGAEHVVFDNGGDIAMFLSHPVVVGVYAGEHAMRQLGMRVTDTGRLLSICTSSGTVGHSLSFGVSDAATVFADDAALADAAATALGNRVSDSSPQTIEYALRATAASGLRGMMVLVGETIGIHGIIPEFVRADVRQELISRGYGG